MLSEGVGGATGLRLRPLDKVKRGQGVSRCVSMGSAGRKNKANESSREFVDICALPTKPRAINQTKRSIYIHSVNFVPFKKTLCGCHITAELLCPKQALW